MKEKIDETEMMDQLLDKLIDDPAETFATTPALDAETVALIRRVVVVEQGQTHAEPDDDAVKQRVWQRVIAGVQPPPVKENDPRKEGSWIKAVFGAHWKPIWITAACVFIAIAVSLYALAIPTASVRAQEVIEKARSAIDLPVDGSVQRFSLTEVQHAIPFIARENAWNGWQGDEQISAETKRWYDSPGRWRVEYQQTVASADGRQLAHVQSLKVSDGTDIWEYDADANTVVVNRVSTATDGEGKAVFFEGDTADLPEFLRQAGTCYQPVITGEGEIAGRAAYIIDMGPSRCPSVAAPEINGRVVLWIDKQTYFTLKQQQYNLQGDQVVITREVTQIQYNSTIDANLFTFTPPAGAVFHDYRPQPAPGAAEFQEALDHLAQQSDYPIFTPAEIPQELAPRLPRRNEAMGNAIELAYVPPAEVEEDTLAEMNGILVQEIKATDERVAAWTGQTEPVGGSAGKAWMRRGRRNADGTGIDSAVLLLQQGTLISVSSFKYAPEELAKVARSMLLPAALGNTPEPWVLPAPTQTPTPSFSLLLPSWLPETMTRSVQVDGEVVTVGFDSHPADPPHDVLTLREMPNAMISDGGQADPQTSEKKIGGVTVNIIRRGEHCISFSWNKGDLYLQLGNPYDPPGQPRYTCDQLRKVIESILN